MANSGFSNKVMNKVLAAAVAAANTFQAELVADLKKELSVPVRGRGRRAIRSLPGEYPRTETGRLVRSVRYTLKLQAKDRIDMLLTVRARHAKWLVKGTIHMEPRPYDVLFAKKWGKEFSRRYGSNLKVRLTKSR